MVLLVLLTCLSANPDQCERVQPPYQEPMSTIECQSKAMLWAAQWAGDHPGYEVREMNCERVHNLMLTVNARLINNRLTAFPACD